jgi:SET domain-containing protein
MKIEVRDSAIGGKGVFATEDIKAGEVIINWHPMVINEEQLKKLASEDRHYLIKVEAGRYYLMQDPEKYVNHSCSPNSKVVGDSDVAISDIEGGVEVTSDYGKEGNMLSFECNCGANNCRHLIKGLLD